MSVSQLAEVLGLKQITIYEWVRENKLPFIKLGRRVLFHPHDVEEFINENRVKEQNAN